MTTAPEPSDSGIQLPEAYQDLQLSLSQQFEIAKFNRIIDNAATMDQLRMISKQLLKSWFVQRTAINFVVKQKAAQIQEETFPLSNGY